jgi:hypothetical protein
MEINRGRGGKQSCTGDANCRAYPSRAEAVHIQIKSRGSAHPRGGKPKGEEEMLMYLSCDLTKRRRRRRESISRDEGGPEEGRRRKSGSRISGEEEGRLESRKEARGRDGF